MKPQFPCLDTLFEQAVALSDPDARRQFISEAAGADEQLRAQLEVLVTAHFRAGDFLAQPLYEAATALVQHPFQPVAHNGMSQHVGEVVGPYKLREVLGEGGMGIVFLAEQKQPVQRKVALKVIKPGMDSRDVLTRFEAERQMLTRLDHPHIAKVLDAGTTDRGTPYFVMEWVKGLPITEHCDTHQLATRDRLNLFLQVCQAVQHAHQKAIIHRDLKPSNVLVAVHDTIPVVKVIDFGVAKALGEQLTENTLYTGVSQLVGTPLYMSPEQAGQSSLDIDTRSDIYSLGVLLYELLTGCTPFDRVALRRGGVDEMRRMIREDEPPRPSERISTLEAEKLSTIAERRDVDPRRLRQHLRGELDWIVMKALDKDRNRRYATANALARDIERYLVGDAVEARPASTTYRMKKLLVRHKIPVTITCLIGMGLLATALLTFALAARARELAERRQQVEQGIGGALAEVARLRAEGERHTVDSGFFLNHINENVQRALALAEAGPAEPTVVEQVQQLAGEVQEELRDDRLMAELDAAWLARAETDVNQNAFSSGAMIRILRSALHDYGLDVGEGNPQEAATRILCRPAAVRESLLTALEQWRHDLIPPVGVGLTTTAGHRVIVRTVADGVQGGVRKGDLLVGVRQTRDGLTIDTRSMTLAEIAPLLRGENGTNVWLEVVSAEGEEPRVCEVTRSPVAQWLRSVVDAANPDPWQRRLREALDLDDEKAKTAALTELADNVDVASQPVQAMTLLAESLSNLEARDQAVRLLKKMQRRYPSDIWVNYGLAHTLANSNPPQRDEAMRYYTAAIALRPDSPGIRLNASMTLTKMCQHDEAIAELREALRIQPQYAAAHSTLARVLFMQGKCDEAVVEYREALRIQPEHAAAHQGLGALFLVQRKSNEAIAEFQQALRTQPDSVAAYEGLGAAYHDLARWDEAKAAFAEQIRLQPASANAHFSIADVYKRQGQLDRAIDEYQAAVKLRPEWSDAHRNLASALEATRRHAEAIAARREVVRLNPQDAFAACELAWLLATASDTQLRQPDQALEFAQLATHLTPTDAACWNALSAAHYCHGDWQEAINAVKKCDELCPGGDVHNWLILAMAHRQLAEHDEARRWREKSLEWMNDPTHECDDLLTRLREESEALFNSAAEATDASAHRE